MKTYGAIKLAKSPTGELRLCIEAPPHLRMKLKCVFPKIDKRVYGHIQIVLSLEAARDILWFVDRYPMNWEGDARAVVEKLSAAYIDRLNSLEGIMAPGYMPRPYELALPLRSYQSVAVDLFLKSGGLLLGDDLGLGKSVTAMGSLTVKESLPALIVCPVHLQRQWKADMLGKFLPMMNVHIVKQTKPYVLPPCDVVILSYSKLAKCAEWLMEAGIKVAIFDECQELRRSESDKYAAAQAISSRVVARMGLSATPVYNYGNEIWNICEVLTPGMLGTLEEFHREWCERIGTHHKVIDPHALGLYLRDHFLMLRRTRAEVGLELPAVERSITSIPFTEKVLDEVQSAATELARLVLTAEFEQSGEAARQLDLKLRQATGVAKSPYVADFVRMLCESGEKVILFGWHHEVYDVWRERLKDLKPVFYTGNETPAQKDESARLFKLDNDKGGARVLIMSLRSGLGLDGLQEVCHTMVFGELDWSPGVHEQCIGRLNRDGVGAGVLAYFLVADGGSDPIVADVLGLKRSQHEGVMNLAPDGGVIGLQHSGGSRVVELANPLGDLDLHSGQMICWCHPCEVEPGIVTHNAKDCREAKERRGERSTPGWIHVAEFEEAP